MCLVLSALSLSMHIASFVITWGTASTVHQKPITELVCAGCTHIVQNHVMSLASALHDDMHECFGALTLLQALELLVNMSCCKTAALPAMSSCSRICPIVLHFSNELFRFCSIHQSLHAVNNPVQRCKPAHPAEIYTSLLLWFWSFQDQLIIPSSAFNDCCCYRISSLCQNMHSMIAVVMIVAGGEGAERCVAQSGARGVAVSTQRAAQPYEFAYDHVSGELGSQDDLFMREC